MDSLKKMGVTLMISGIQRTTTGSGLKREICLALNKTLTSLKALVEFVVVLILNDTIL